MRALKSIFGNKGIYSIFVTALIIAALFSYYWLVYVGGNDDKMQKRNFRVLNQVEKNIEKTIKDNSEVASIMPCDTPEAHCKGFLYEEIAKKDEGHKFLNHPARVVFDFAPKCDSIKKYKLDTSKILKLSKPLAELIDPILRRDVFTNYIIILDSQGVYNDFSDIKSIINDTLLSKGWAYKKACMMDVAGTSFYVFAKHLTMCDGDDYILAGLIPVSEYNKEKFAVPGNFLMLVIMILFLTMVSFPFLKSLLMSPEETLNSSDVIFSVIALFLICFIFTFLHLQGYVALGPGTDERNSTLKNTNNSIEQSFLAELDSIYKQLFTYDTLYDCYPELQQDILEIDSIRYKALGRKYPALEPEYKHFKLAFWIKKNGEEIYNWRTDHAKPLKQKYTERNYFKVKNYWYLRGETDKPFFLEPINSWTDGSYRAVMSIPRKSTAVPVAAMSSYMISVINTLHPEEISFCIIDNKGDVLFHSESSRSKNENLLEECNYDLRLQSAIYSRTNEYFDSHYLGKDCHFYVSPVKDLPLYVVTFANRAFHEDISVQIFVLSFIHILFILLVIGSVIFILIFAKNRHRLLEFQLLEIEWLYPSDSFSSLYLALILMNLLLFGFSVIITTITNTHPFVLLGLFIINAGGTTACFFYSTYSRSRYSGTLNQIKSAKALLEYKLRILGILFCLIALVLDIVLYYLNGKVSDALIGLLCYEFLFVLIFLNVIKYRYGLSFFRELKKTLDILQPKFYHFYAVLLVSWLLLVAVLPTTSLYQLFYNVEHESLIKYMQVGIAEKLYAKATDSKTYFSLPNHGTPTDSAYTNLYLSDYHNTFLSDENEKIKKSVLGNKQTRTGIIREKSRFYQYINQLQFSINTSNELMMRLSPPENRDSSTIQFFVDTLSSYNRQHFAHLPNRENEKHVCANTFVDWLSGNSGGYYVSLLYRNTRGRPVLSPAKNAANFLSDNKITIRSSLPYYKHPGIMHKSGTFNFSFFLYWLIPVFFLIAIYFLIVYFLKRFFFFDFLSLIYERDDQHQLNMIRSKAEKQKGLLRLIITGLPQSGKMALAKDSLKPGENLVEFDFTESHKVIPFQKDMDETSRKNTVYLIKHFEYHLMDKKLKTLKFDFIRHLLQKEIGNIIIISSIHPSVFLNGLKKNNHTFDAEDYIANEEYYNWSNLLSTFTIYEHRKRFDASLAENEDDTYREQQWGQAYYHAIWSGLDRLEKFVLYDLAEDHLANFKNKQGLLSLFNKGLITGENAPTIADSSFRNFILSQIDRGIVTAEKKKGDSRTSWNSFKIPFLIIALVVLFFVFYTQQESFNKLIATVTAFAVIIPAFSQFVSFTRSKK